jgi:SsrA-binding protein
MEIRNRSAFHEYFIEDKYDAGMVLTGTEVKALRSGKASFNDSFCTIDREEVWLRNLHISEYEFGSYANHPPMRERKLLLRKREIKKLVNKLKDKGYTLVPLKIWFNEKGTRLHQRARSPTRTETIRSIALYSLAPSR